MDRTVRREDILNTIADEIMRRLERIENKIEVMSENLASVQATCDLRGVMCRREKEEYSCRVRSLENDSKKMIGQLARLSIMASIGASVMTGLLGWLLR